MTDWVLVKMDMIQVRCKGTNIMEKNYLIQIKFGFISVAVLILMLMLILMFFLKKNPQEMRFGASWILFQSKMRKVKWCCSSCPSKTSLSPTGRAAVTTTERTVRFGCENKQT